MEEPLYKPKKNEALTSADKKALEEYNEREQEKNIKLHKGVLIFFIVINAIGIVFYCTYSIQISSLNANIDNISNEIVSKEAALKETRQLFDHLIVKLYSDIRTDMKYLSELIETPEEYEMLMQWLPPTESKQRLFFCYKSIADGLEPTTFREQCSYDNNVLIILRADNAKRFGGFVELNWDQMNDDTPITSNVAFLFSIDDKEKFKVKDATKSFKLLSKGFFMFGDEDLSVEEMHENKIKAYSKFPKSYEGNKRFINEEYFKIVEMEVFNYVQYDEDYYS